MYKFNVTLEPLWVSKVQLYKGQTVKEHAHEHYYHLVYIISGRCDFTINGKGYALSDNMLTIARPGEVCGWCNNGEAPVNTYEVKFSVMEEDLREALEQLPPVIYSSLFTKTLIERISQERDNRYLNFAEYISIYLNVLLYDLVRDTRRYSPSTRENSHSESPSQIAARYIEDHYSEDLSLNSLAEVLGFNKSYLATTFKNSAGITVNEYIYKVRVYKACELIAYSDLPLAEVSNATGFKNVQHFTRVFKKHIGIPPGEYRNATPKKMINYAKVPTLFNTDVLPVRSGKLFEVESDSGYYRPKDSNT